MPSITFAFNTLNFELRGNHCHHRHSRRRYQSSSSVVRRFRASSQWWNLLRESTSCTAERFLSWCVTSTLTESFSHTLLTPEKSVPRAGGGVGTVATTLPPQGNCEFGRPRPSQVSALLLVGKRFNVQNWPIIANCEQRTVSRWGFFSQLVRTVGAPKKKKWLTC